MTDGERLVLKERLLDAQDSLPDYESALGQAKYQVCECREALTELAVEIMQLEKELADD